MESVPGLTLFWITFLSGFAAYYLRTKNDQSIKLFLSFSGAFLLATCVVHLLPELFENKEINVAPYILIGFFLQILIEYFSQGVEHGHIHQPHNHSTFPYLIYLGLCFHAFTEGLPLAGVDFGNMFDSPLYWSILLHKIPIVIVLISLFTAYEVARKSVFVSLIIFSLMAPLGGMIGKLIVVENTENVLLYFLAASTGIFLHISTVILFETSHNHRFNFMKFMFIVAGGLLSMLIF
jgi:zinc and cadmium transporter